ncbi:phosphatidylinositol N-acetylglucosaminyltransferase subunit Q-like [Symsagittifera roscoffensis]|uniref:phosphatidylinositol N-acetylglucosaminyltransferase subunit Q-like n=1 Tax=Symsagittifera roscoffensis TaxID=84072 RepID=UPI00307C87A6
MRIIFLPTSEVECLSFQSSEYQCADKEQAELKIRDFKDCYSGPSHFGRVMSFKMKLISFVRENSGTIFALDLIASLFLDSIGGIFILLALMKCNALDVFDTRLATEWAQFSVGRLESMITFMTNTPIGLKLNLPLANFLGQLFLYHLYVWLTWVKLLQPMLPFLLYGGLITLILGISVFTSLLFDFFQIMTLHLFCFYLYAVRMYAFTWKSLQSLWLLFRGKKFNPNKKRVDTQEYETDQFLLGSLVFTTFLFLFPTIAVFYFVFAIIQLAFSAAKYILFQAATVIYQPYISFLYQFAYPDSYYTAVYVETKTKSGKYEFKRKKATKLQILRCFYKCLPAVWFPVSPMKTMSSWLTNIAFGSSIEF